jgi:Mg-chelatase subunit ChlD
MAVLGLFVFAAMLLVAGMAVDMMRVEHERVRMQGAADRAVLAATMLRRTDAQTPSEIVQGYLHAEGLAGHVEERVEIVATDLSRVVTAAPAARMPSVFMRLMGIKEIDIATSAQAAESLARIDFDVVLVLDVSGSMDWDGRIAQMHEAASEFAAAMLDGAAPGQVSISIVPYSTEVRLPPPLMDALADLEPATNPQAWDIDEFGWPLYDANGMMTFHTDPSCIDLRDWGGVSSWVGRLQSAPLMRRFCDERSNTAHHTPQAQVLMTDLAQIDSYVRGMGAVWGTSIDIGVIAGALLFDPALRPAMNAFVPAALAGTTLMDRPFDWDRPHVVRAMVVMTDGENCCYHEGDPSTRTMDPVAHDTATIAACHGLRDRGVSIYTVAFMAPERGADLMMACASSSNHFHQAGSDGLIDTFRAIGRHIQLQSLRLTQ